MDSLDKLVARANKEDIRKIESEIAEFLISLKKSEERNLSYSSRKCFLAAIIGFYKQNYIEVDRKRLSKYLGDPQKTVEDRAYTKEEIAKVLKPADLRLRALILLFCSAGPRFGAVSSLKLKNLTAIKTEGSGTDSAQLYRIEFYPRYKEKYYSLCTPECAAAINEYLEYRQRYGENLNAESPLFREQFNSDRLPKSKQGLRHLTSGAIRTLVDGALKRAGVRIIEHQTETNSKAKAKMRKEASEFNGFRKFFNTVLVESEVSWIVKEMLMGHRLGLDDSYYRPDRDVAKPQYILKEYLKAVDNLTINNENRLMIKVEELQEEKKEWDTVKDQIQDLRKMLIDSGRAVEARKTN